MKGRGTGEHPRAIILATGAVRRLLPVRLVLSGAERSAAAVKFRSRYADRARGPTDVSAVIFKTRAVEERASERTTELGRSGTTRKRSRDVLVRIPYFARDASLRRESLRVSCEKTSK